MISAVVGIRYQMITYLHSCRISDEESSHEQNIIMNDDSALALTTNLLALNFKAIYSVVKQLLHRKCMGNI